MVRWLTGLLGGALLLAGCEASPCPYGSMLESDEGLIVTEAEHPTGWGEAECAQCHALPQLHRQGCTPGIDMEAVRQQVESEGVHSCVDCHGDNGAEPLDTGVE